MRLLVLGIIFALTLVSTVASGTDDKGWDDLNCNELFEMLVKKHVIPKHDRIRDAICKYEIDGDFLESLHVECGRLDMEHDECVEMRKHLDGLAARPSIKFRDFWDWRAHHKRLSDHWLLPLSLYVIPYLLPFTSYTFCEIHSRFSAVRPGLFFFICIFRAMTHLWSIGSTVKILGSSRRAYSCRRSSCTNCGIHRPLQSILIPRRKCLGPSECGLCSMRATVLCSPHLFSVGPVILCILEPFVNCLSTSFS